MSRQQRRIRDKRRRHARLTRGRAASAAGGLAVAAALLSAPMAHAGAFQVTSLDDSGAGTLRDAITQANGTAGPSTITISNQLSGNVFLASALPTITQPVTITGPKADQVRFYANGDFGIFTAAANLEIDDVGLGDGNAAQGGAVDMTAAGATLTLNGDEIDNSTASGTGDAGGAIYAQGALTVTGSTFYDDTAPNGAGGAIATVTGGAGTINDSTITGGAAVQGAGIAVDSPSGLTITGSTIVGNTASGTGAEGGGLDIGADSGAVTIQDTIVSGNTATTGSDIGKADSAPVPATAFSLIGTLSGSGITTAPASDIVGQDPGLNPLGLSGGAVQTMAPASGSPVLDAGKAFGLTIDERGDTRPNDLPLVANAAGGDGSDIGAVEATANDLTPTITSLSAYAGTTGDKITITGSGFTDTHGVSFGATPATSFTEVSDTEITAVVPQGSGTVAVSVTNPYGTRSTASARDFSYPGLPLTVTTTADTGPGSLRQVITDADAGGSHMITFASSVTGAIDPASDLPAITVPVTIAGPGADQLAIDGGTTSDLLQLDSYAPSTISGLTITGSAGSGVETEGPLTATGLDVSGNATKNVGGGLYVRGAATIADSTISGNTAYFGAGIYAGDGTTITDSTITGNTAGVAGGGALIGGHGGVTITASTITGNTVSYASGAGGGLATNYGPTIDDSIVSGNTAGYGPDISADDAGQASFSLIGDLTGSEITPDATDIVGQDPKLGPLKDNGGEAPTMLPAPGSPVIDAGKAFGLTTDQRGVARPIDLPEVGDPAGGDGSDIGAVEVREPAVTGLSPASGSAGATITISGAQFTGATQVLFGTTPATAFTVAGDGQITATVPAGSGKVDVRVTGPEGESGVVGADAFTYVVPNTTTTTTTTTTTKPTPTPVPTTRTLTATFQGDKISLTIPAAGSCTASPFTATLSSAAVSGGKAKPARFVRAAFYLDKGVRHTRRRKVHGKSKTVTSYTANLVTRKATSTDRLTAKPGTHTLKVVITYALKVTQHHHTRTVTKTKAITTTITVC